MLSAVDAVAGISKQAALYVYIIDVSASTAANSELVTKSRHGTKM